MNRWSIALLLVGLTLVAFAGISHASVVPPWQIEVVDPDAAGHLSLALTDAGYPRIAYRAHGNLQYAWRDASLWNLDIVDTQPGATGWYPSLRLQGADSPHISYFSPYSRTLMYAARVTNTWEIEALGDPYTTTGQTSLALDSAGLPHIAYFDYSQGSVGYAWDDGATWHYDVIDTVTSINQFVSLALTLDAADRPHLCYYDVDANALLHAYQPGTDWLFETVDSDVSYNGQECDIELDSYDRVHISYSDLHMFYARRDGTTWHISTVDDTFAVGRFSSLALDATDHPHIIYTGSIGSSPALLYAYSAGFAWHVETVDVTSSPQRFEDVSLALDDDRRPHVAYWALSDVDILKYAFRDAAMVRHPVYLPIVVRP